MLLIHRSQARKHDTVEKGINNMRNSERDKATGTSDPLRYRTSTGAEAKAERCRRRQEGRERRYKENTLEASSAAARLPPVAAAVECGRWV
jgi:hypothetical protein